MSSAAYPIGNLGQSHLGKCIRVQDGDDTSEPGYAVAGLLLTVEHRADGATVELEVWGQTLRVSVPPPASFVIIEPRE